MLSDRKCNIHKFENVTAERLQRLIAFIESEDNNLVVLQYNESSGRIMVVRGDRVVESMSVKQMDTTAEVDGERRIVFKVDLKIREEFETLVFNSAFEYDRNENGKIRQEVGGELACRKVPIPGFEAFPDLPFEVLVTQFGSICNKQRGEEMLQPYYRVLPVPGRYVEAVHRALDLYAPGDEIVMREGLLEDIKKTSELNCCSFQKTSK